jgi:tRNA dimethylallyltransferase
MKACFLVGPTATGKSAVAHLLALEMNAAILCADAMTVYRALDIGTAKPDVEMRASVRYFGLDLVDPDQSFSAGAFLEEARRAAQAATSAGQQLIVVGGSGLYLSALLRGLDPASAQTPETRARWEAVFREHGIQALQDALRARSPEAWASLADQRNPRRLIRALERVEAGAPAPTAWRKVKPPPVAALRMEPDALKRRIAARVSEMMRRGLIDEAARIRARWPVLSQTARHAIGYEEAYAVLDGRMTERQAIEQIIKRTWHLARRQMTWFRHQISVFWIEVGEFASVRQIADTVRRYWIEHEPHALHI